MLLTFLSSKENLQKLGFDPWHDLAAAVDLLFAKYASMQVKGAHVRVVCKPGIHVAGRPLGDCSKHFTIQNFIQLAYISALHKGGIHLHDANSLDVACRHFRCGVRHL